MWATLRTEIAARILTARTYFSTITGSRGTPAPPPSSPAEATARGLMFVQLYAIHEYTLKEVVRIAIGEMKSRGMPFNTIRLELLSLALDQHLQAAADCGLDKRWPSRIGLFKRVASTDPLDVADDAFPGNGTQFRMPQLYVIWEVFGIDHGTNPVIPDARRTQWIHELVEARNAVAHGRETPEGVGSRHSRNDIHDRIDWTEAICYHVVNTMQSHCSNPTNLQR